MKINFFLNSFFKFDNKESILYFKGDLFYKGERLSYQEITSLIDEYEIDFLNDTDGFFSFVYIKKNKIIAVVDKIRSIPLFYSNLNGVLEFSESYKNLTKDYSYDQVNKEIFQLCSYTVGNDTLVNEINQLVAGQYLIHKENRVSIGDYYLYTSDNLEESSFNREEFKSYVYEALKSSFEKLINLADGREIVIPLSGGYDSRLVASMLKELNYSNIICFSYGVKGNKEAEYSKYIANNLGFKWHFIEYNDIKWRDLWKSDLAKLYTEYASNSASLPHIQDFLAVYELKNKKIISNDALFIPGHCCVTSYITNEVLGCEDSRKSSLSFIINRHFNLSPLSENKIIVSNLDLYQFVEEKISKNIDLDSGLVNSIILFNWRERQSKYIANSVRVYDFFDFNWWLPLWDTDFIELWRNMPNIERVDRAIFKEIVSDIYERNSTIKKNLGNARTQSYFYKFFSRIIKYLPLSFSGILKKLYRIKEYKGHYLAFDAIVEDSDLSKLTKKGYKIIGIYCYKYLKGNWHD